MQTIRRALDRGQANFDWLDSQHSFSFAGYYDPQYMGFGPLRVINEDKVAPGRGFDTHAHRDMEIISYVVSGAMAHEDSLGNGSTIYPGEVQRMTAGTGVEHSEYNVSRDQPLHFLQIWIEPEIRGLPPSYEQISFAPADTHNNLHLLASREGRDGSLVVHQDVDLFLTRLSDNASLTHNLRQGRVAWLQVVAGAVTVNTLQLAAGDGVAIETPQQLALHADAHAEVLIFDMAASTDKKI